ncbi:hydantoinase/oxoprolinase family protein [Methylophaga sp.]|uniref:hydantoinase/oxoprolinase family protein n=1 Tax=Methylophaga sp. TaxID=2024840 RepID=UPI003F69BB7B
MMKKNNVTGFCGWDIGGAHLKVAQCDTQGQLKQVLQLPCALWRGIEELDKAMQQALQILDCASDHHAVTMTGELVDAFDSRQDGVEKILHCVTAILSKDSVHIFAGKQNWLSKQQAQKDWHAVASMNWQASAMLAASQNEQGLFIDIGSTTCDVIPFVDHEIQPFGLDDHARQKSGELVYSGAIRTPLLAISTHAPFNGEYVPLAAEWFASSGDIWSLLDKLSTEDIQDNSADGKPWGKKYCQSRLARMLATDAENATSPQWRDVAKWFSEQQLHQITNACLQVLSRQVDLTDDAPLVGAGIGRFMVETIANRLQRPYLDYSDLCQNSPQAATHAPAAALALLAQQQLS